MNLEELEKYRVKSIDEVIKRGVEKRMMDEMREEVLFEFRNGRKLTRDEVIEVFMGLYKNWRLEEMVGRKLEDMGVSGGLNEYCVDYITDLWIWENVDYNEENEWDGSKYSNLYKWMMVVVDEICEEKNLK